MPILELALPEPPSFSASVISRGPLRIVAVKLWRTESGVFRPKASTATSAVDRG